MKKLDFVQMENLQGGIKNRDCMLIGAITVFGCLLGPEVLVGGLLTAAGAGCFS